MMVTTNGQENITHHEFSRNNILHSNGYNMDLVLKLSQSKDYLA